jgi:putative DeoR family transcriptional regulator (stage III sporulation protein D)
MIERLPTINKRLANKVRNVLETNKAERHIRGGEATRKKYKDSKESSEK